MSTNGPYTTPGYIYLGDNPLKGTSDDWYYFEGFYYRPKAYWTLMYERYKGTEHEEKCLAELLAGDE